MEQPTSHPSFFMLPFCQSYTMVRASRLSDMAAIMAKPTTSLDETMRINQRLSANPALIQPERQQTTRVLHKSYECSGSHYSKHIPVGTWACDTHTCGVPKGLYECTVDTSLCPTLDGAKSTPAFTEVTIFGQKCATGNGGCNCDPKQCNPEVNKKHVNLTCSYPITNFTVSPTVARVTAYQSAFVDDTANITAAMITTNTGLLDAALRMPCEQTLYSGNDCPVGYASGCSGLITTSGDIQEVCRDWIGSKTDAQADVIKTSICTRNPDFQECACINRTANSDYQDLNGSIGAFAAAQCWYLPCTGDDMAQDLITSDTQDLSVCPGDVCAQIIDVIGSGGVTLENVAQRTTCDPLVPPKDPTLPESGDGSGNGDDADAPMSTGDRLTTASMQITPASLVEWINDNQALSAFLFLSFLAIVGITLFY